MAAWKGLVAAVAGLVGLALAPASRAQAPAAPILEAPAILGLPETSQASVRRFLNLNTPRVLAFGPNGTFGWQAGGGDAAFVEQTALASCERRAGPGACTIGLRDLSIVKPGREWAPSPPPGAASLEVHNDGALGDAGLRLLNALENLPGWPQRSGKLSPIAPILSNTP